MSRTFRRKNETREYDWVLRDWDNWVWSLPTVRPVFTIESKSGKKALAKYHSDAGTHSCKEPGPSWFRKITRQRPLRREGKNKLRKFMLDEEIEVIIEEKPPLEYWT